MEKDEMLKSKGGRCPYCKSNNVINTGKISDVRPSSSPNLPKPKKKIWLCNKCKKSFFYQGE